MQEIQRSSSIDQIDIMEEEEEIQGFDEDEELNKIKTLYGFVDEDSIDQVTTRAEDNLLKLQVSNYSYLTFYF